MGFEGGFEFDVFQPKFGDFGGEFFELLVLGIDEVFKVSCVPYLR